MTTKESKRITEVIRQLRDQIDAFAERVQPIYEMLNWTWTSITPDGSPKVPQVENIRAVLEQLVASLESLLRKNSEKPVASTGGLTARGEYSGGLLNAYIEFTVRKAVHYW